MVPVPALLALGALLVVEVVSYLALRRYATGLDSLPSVVMEEFPEIDRALLEKYTSFDPELGWCPQPNVTKQKDTGDHLPGEEVRSVVTYSTDEYGSRVCPARERPAHQRAAGVEPRAASTAVDGAGESERDAGGDAAGGAGEDSAGGAGEDSAGGARGDAAGSGQDASTGATGQDAPTGDAREPVAGGAEGAETQDDEAEAVDAEGDDTETIDATAASGDRSGPDERAPTVSTYGDSYCFCREVDDDETVQHYLAQRLDAHVGNYGGGNYGLDQALLRLRRQYPRDPTDYVVVIVTASSIARVLSVWKHYQEFGNVLAVKPRFEFDDDGELTLIDSPVDEKAELRDLESRADYLRRHDGHYERWFRPHLAGFPYAREFLRDEDHVRYAAYGALQDLEERLGRALPGIDAAERQRRAAMRLERPRVRYHERLFAERADLFAALLGEFVDYAEEQGFTPVFAMVGQLRYATYRAEHGPVYGDLLQRIDEQLPDLVTLDVPEQFPESEDPEAVESLYVDRGEGGHYSPETNERIADLLAATVRDREERERIDAA